MADYISLSLSEPSNADLNLTAYNNGREDPRCYMKVGNDSGFLLQPKETISVLIIPQSDPITDSEASGYLADSNQKSDSSRGMFIYRTENSTSSEKTLTELTKFPFDKTFENIKFNLYWLQDQEGAVIFDKISGVYSFPHNLQPNEIDLSAELIEDNTRVRYTLKFPEVNNSGSADYVTEKPYLLNISYSFGAGTITGYFDGSPITFDNSTDYTEFDPGWPTSGIIFDLPFYDSRPYYKSAPAIYVFKVNYNCADPDLTGSFPIEIPINHQQWSENQIIKLDSNVTNYADKSKLRKVDEVFIERGVIDRKRFSIGIKDISIKSNVYKKKGIYISKPYTTDFPVYTFSLKVDEFIPEYKDVDPYSLVQYFIEFNSKPWIRISPINRNLELDGSSTVPKMFIFDSDPGEGSESILFLNYQSPVNIFRVKIIFDLSAVNETNFIPPEIRDYNCIVFDKNQLLGN